MAKKKNRRWLIWTLIVVVVLLVVAAAIRAKNRPKGELVEIENVERRNIYETVSASGKLYPENSVRISSDVSGEIVDLFVSEGDTVTKGQILAHIDPETIESQVERGEAAVNNARASLAMAKANLESAAAQVTQIKAQLKNAREIHKRNEQLFKDGVISEADLQNSQANLDQLIANMEAAEANKRSAEQSVKASQYSVNSARATLKELQTNLDRTTIISPYNGVVSQLAVEEGERVVGTMQFEGTQMMRIADMSLIFAGVDVSENDIVRVSIGDSADVEVDAYLDRKFRGIVTEISNAASNINAATTDQVTNFEVKVRLIPESYEDMVITGKAHPFRPGMTATVDIYTRSAKNALSVPIQTVTTREYENGKKGDSDDDLREVVFVIKGDTVGMVDVTTGIQDAEYIEIISGLEEGEEVVTGPYATVSRRLSSGDAFTRKEKKEDEKE